MKKELPSGGWQSNVAYFDDYVIKNPKTLDETRRKVSRYLRSKGKDSGSEIERVVGRIRDDWVTGLDIVKSGKLPNKMLGNLEFLEDGSIWQTRVRVLEEVWNELYDSGNEEEMRKIVDKSLDFIVELWRYGVHEKTFKVGYEYGLMGDEVVLIDFGELCCDKDVAARQLVKKPWRSKVEKYCSLGVSEYYNARADEVLTLDVLEKNWGRNLKG